MRRAVPLLVTTTVLSVGVAATMTGVALGSGVVKSPLGSRPGADTKVSAAAAGQTAITPIGDRSVRVAGVSNRFQTAVALSEFSGWDGTNTTTVYLVTGNNYPDALAVGASDFDLGPILYTNRDSLPAVTAAELDRLDPCEVVIVGGTASVSDIVAQQADTYTVECEPPVE